MTEKTRQRCKISYSQKLKTPLWSTKDSIELLAWLDHTIAKEESSNGSLFKESIVDHLQTTGKKVYTFSQVHSKVTWFWRKFGWREGKNAAEMYQFGTACLENLEHEDYAEFKNTISARVRELSSQDLATPLRSPRRRLRSAMPNSKSKSAPVSPFVLEIASSPRLRKRDYEAFSGNSTEEDGSTRRVQSRHFSKLLNGFDTNERFKDDSEDTITLPLVQDTFADGHEMRSEIEDNEASTSRSNQYREYSAITTLFTIEDTQPACDELDAGADDVPLYTERDHQKDRCKCSHVQAEILALQQAQDSDVQYYQDQIQFYQVQAPQAQEEVQLYCDQAPQAQEEVQLYQGQASQAQVEVQLYQSQAPEAQVEVQFYREQVSQAQEEVQFYRDQVSQAQEEVQFYRDQVSQAQVELQDLKRELTCFGTVEAVLSDDSAPSRVFCQQDEIYRLKDLLNNKNALRPFSSLASNGLVQLDFRQVQNKMAVTRGMIKQLLSDYEVQETWELIKIDEHDGIKNLLCRSLGLELDQPLPMPIISFGKEASSLAFQALIRSLVAAALCDWVFNSDLQDISVKPCALLEKYRRHLLTQDGEIALRNLDFAAHQSLIEEDFFKKHTVPRKATLLADQFSRTVAPLFSPNYNSEGSSSEALSLWDKERTKLVEIFGRALKIKSRTFANRFSFEAVLYSPGTPFDKAIMDSETIGGDQADLSLHQNPSIMFCSMPALHVYTDDRMLVSYDNFIQRTADQRAESNRISKAMVVLEDPGLSS